MGMTRSKGIVLAIALFLTGALVGGLAGEAWHFLRGGPFGKMERLGPKGFILERLSEDLVLSADQKEKLKPIIEEMVDRLDQVRKPFFDQERAIFQEYQDKISSQLTPEQVAKHKALLERLSRRHGPGMPPPPGMLPPPPGGPPPGEPPHGPPPSGGPGFAPPPAGAKPPAAPGPSSPPASPAS